MIRATTLAALAGCLLPPATPAVAQDSGAALFADTCQACHGPAGEGIPGFAPPLDRPAFWDGLGADAPLYLAGVMVSGLVGRITAGGETYVGVQMPAQTGLSDDEMIAVADYVLGTLGGSDLTLTQDMLAAVQADRPRHADLIAMRPAEE